MIIAGALRTYLAATTTAGGLYSWNQGPRDPTVRVAGTITGGLMAAGALPVLGVVKVAEAVSRIFQR